MQEEQLQFISPLAYITYCPAFIICNKFLIEKKNPLETNKNEYCTIYTLLFDVDVILNDLEI